MSSCKNIRILELYCGIGGMHYAFKDSGITGEIAMSIDLNPLATSVYKHNFNDTVCLNKNILSLSPQSINDLNINTILMSPPCQPFTRNGNQKDVEDARTSSFLHILKILPHIKNLQFILLENVMGFEKSVARDNLITVLQNNNFNIREYLRSPKWVGVPNSRMRYYCLANKNNNGMQLKHQIQFEPETEAKNILSISNYLENDANEDYLLPPKVLSKYVWALDICHPEERRSTCFTKAYTHYANGTGSVLSNISKKSIENIFEKCEVLSPEDKLEHLQRIKLRYFTPREVARIMCFPDNFSFPREMTRKQCYRLLGNSINVKVVSHLICILINEPF